MLRTLFIIMACTFASLMAMAQSTYTVTSQKVNVRKAPNTSSAVAGSLTKGQTVSVKQIRNGWATINYKGATCYVKADFLRATENKKDEAKAQQNTTAKRETTKPTTEKAEKPQKQSYTSSNDEYGKNDKIKGFGMSTDLRLGYSDKTLKVEVDYDLGHQFSRVFYWGAGPLLAGSFGDGANSFHVGAATKMRIVIPSEGNIRPMFDLRGGYTYNIDAGKGAFFGGAGIGLNLSGKYSIGLAAQATSVEKMKAKGKKFTTEKKLHLEPQIFFSYDFGKTGTSPRKVIPASELQRREQARAERKAKIKKFFKTSYISTDLMYAFGMWSKDGVSQGTYYGADISWSKEIGQHFSIGPGFGYRIYKDKQEGATFPDLTMLPIYVRSEYSFNEVIPKLKPFVRVDAGMRFKTSIDEFDREQESLFIEPQAGVSFGDLYLLVGYTSITNNYAVYDRDRDHSVGSTEFRLGYRF